MPRLTTPCDVCAKLVECVLITAIPGGRQPDRRATTITMCTPCLLAMLGMDAKLAPAAPRCPCSRCGTTAVCSVQSRPKTTTVDRVTLTITHDVPVCAPCISDAADDAHI